MVDIQIFPDDHGELPGPGEYSVSDPEEREDEGSDLVDPRPSVLSRAPSLLDLPRELVEAGLFESYTYTGVVILKRFIDIYLPLSRIITTNTAAFPGISSSLLSFRPFSLKHGSRYMLEVTTSKSENENENSGASCMETESTDVLTFTLRISRQRPGKDAAFLENQPSSKRDDVSGAAGQRI